MFNMKPVGRRIRFIFDTDDWYFPLSVRVLLCGNNHRPYNIRFSFLCFAIVICIDEECF